MMLEKYSLPALLLVLSSCSAGTKLNEGSTAVRVAESLPAPDSPEIVINPATYRLGPTDEIVVSVFGAPELDREGRIDAAGNFAMPLAGTVRAGGKTPDELARAIEEKLRGRYVRDPQVAVNIKEALGHLVTIDGQVREPGVYPVLGQMTLQQAVATAKGASDSADIENVVVFRTVNGERMAAMFNLRDIRAGRLEDPQIYGNDIVVVGEDSLRRWLRDTAITFPILGRFIPMVL